MIEKEAPSASEPDRAARLESELARLRARMEFVERLILGVGCWVAAALILIGMFTPMYTTRRLSGTVDAWSVMSVWTTGILGSNADASAESQSLSGLEIAFLIGFIGLTVVALLVLVFVLPAVATRSLAGRKNRTARILVGLGLCGSFVPGLLTVLAIGAEDSHPAWGSAVLIVGMAFAAVLVSSLSERLTAPADR